MLTVTHKHSLIVTVAAIAGAAIPATASTQTRKMQCTRIAQASSHGGSIAANSNLSPIRHGRVLTIDPNTGAKSRSRFTARSGRWMTGADGTRYAVAGQWISHGGHAGGRQLIAAPMRPGHRVPCAGPSPLAQAADTASVAADGSLPASGYIETSSSSTNVHALLVNYATRDICTNTNVHPDGAPLSAVNPHPSTNVWCYTGRGACLNDPNGIERYSPAEGGGYIDDTAHRHYIQYLGATVAAAKRPATYPDGRIIPNSPIVWRPVAKNATLCN
jgi:hypothetical protein